MRFVVRRALQAYSSLVRRAWYHLPASIQGALPGRLYGRHVHRIVRAYADRKQYFGTFFLRNREELELIRRLVRQFGSRVRLAVLACSKGAEVYSLMWAIRSARPDLDVQMHAVDISEEILDFAERGVYSLATVDAGRESRDEGTTFNTHRDQNAPIFARMTEDEVSAMCSRDGDRASIRQWLRQGIRWVAADVCDPGIVDLLGLQDVVLANRFLCHMAPRDAESCLRNVARLVAPGGYLFVSGVDLDVRTRVARSQGWEPVRDLMREIHEGDVSLRRGWPVEYWGLEPLFEHRSDRDIRYVSAFRVGHNRCSAPAARLSAARLPAAE